MFPRTTVRLINRQPALPWQIFSLRMCSSVNENAQDQKIDLKKLSNKARVIELKKQKKAASSNANKILSKTKPKKSLYEVHEFMSVKDISQLTGAPLDILLDVVLSHDECRIRSERSPIHNKKILTFIASKINCGFRFVPPPKQKSPERDDNPNLDIVHDPPKLEDLVPRPPVVAIVGHIDHGKTTLLDRLRQSNVVETEFGGITQHIGAFSVALNKFNSGMVTFLDTPGHAAFKNMRVRGALVTDVVILVVDASEGPLEQTIESIDAVKKARVSLIVALNKIDKPGADIEATKKALYEAGVALEDFGGDVQAVPISALKGDGVEDLIEAVLAQAEVLQLSADHKGPVEGSIIESFQEPGLGKTATVLLKRGTLMKGQILVSGETYTKVRQVLHTKAPISDRGAQRNEMKKVGPAEACRVTGWKAMPSAGDDVMEVPNEKRAAEVVRWRVDQRKDKENQGIQKIIEEKRKADREVYNEYRTLNLKKGQTRSAIFNRNTSEAHEIIKERMKGSDTDHRVSIIVKTDVDGSLDAILNCFETYDEEEVELDIITTKVGEVTENDLVLAKEFDGIIYAFNVSISDAIRKAASSIYDGVPIREYQVIYALMDDLKEEINQKLPEVDEEIVLGKAMVAQEFMVNDKKATVRIAGCHVNQGILYKDKEFKLIRGKEVFYEGKLQSLKHHKDEVENIEQGRDCGLRLADNSIEFKAGDSIVCYELKPMKRETNWTPF